MTGGPPVRDKLIHQQVGYDRWSALDPADELPAVAHAQRAAHQAVSAAQREVCRAGAQGVVETLGLAAWPAPESQGVWVQLPPEADIDLVAEAITQEGALARHDAEFGYLLLPLQPWFNLDEIDQSVLCCAKVVHVMLGVHPPGLDLAAHLADGASCHLPSLDAAATLASAPLSSADD